jgi:di/tricarboxylate transporter
MFLDITTDQALIFTILILVIGLFIWDRWRFDLVALLALLACVMAGLVKPAEAFNGFGDPVVTTVACILVISAAIGRSGFIDWSMKLLSYCTDNPKLQVGVLVFMVMTLSAFMNNVGALAVFLPIALAAAKKAERPPSELLMPLSFGSLLGGLVTLIGTPPNILISSIRRDITGEGYNMFDFAPVGLSICALGLIYLSFAWRFIPKNRRGNISAEDLFEIEDYISEVSVPEASPFEGQTIRFAEEQGGDSVAIVSLIRDGQLKMLPSKRMMIRAQDILLVEGDPASLQSMVDKGKLGLAGSHKIEEIAAKEENISVTEVVIMAGSPLIGESPRGMDLRAHYAVNILAIKRSGRPVRKSIGNTSLREGDVIVVQGDIDHLPDVINQLGCLPLAQRNLQLGRGRKFYLPVIIMAIAVMLTAFEIVPISISFFGAVMAIAFFKILRLDEIYKAIDGPVIILLAAMIPVSKAFETTGGAEILSALLADSAQHLSGPLIVGLILTATMLVTPFLNNAAAVLVMAPVAAGLAAKLSYNIDPFLIAVAVGASSDFLTPIGHQSNTLVMGPGGYKFSDYWRLGFPLSLLIIAVGTPLILWVWPL